MALNEPILGGAVVPVAGRLYTVNGQPTICPNTGAATITAWKATIGGSPVIRSCDTPGRTTGAFLPSSSVYNMTLQGQLGGSLFD